MPYKDRDMGKEKKKEYYEENKEKEKEKAKERYEKNKEKIKEQRKERYEKNKEKEKESETKRYVHRKKNALNSIATGVVVDKKEMDKWFNEIKRSAKRNKHPYSDDFTSDVMFDMMIQGCFYCGDIATTIDRIDSKLDHIHNNCVSSCHGCNMAKGVADSSTFIRKAYYRVCRKYYDDDTDIWFVHKNKPRLDQYKRKAEKQGVVFDLTLETLDNLVKGDCAYCHRVPITWFGIDRVVPSQGYVLDNVVPCCLDCNVDKLEDDVNTTRMRNERIVDRVVSGQLIIPKCDKVILHMGTR